MADADMLVALIGPLARALYGEPNGQQSSKTELRFGTNGSLSIDLSKGTWFDFETQEGGGVLDLVKRAKGFQESRECYQWLEAEGYWINGRPRRNGNDGAQQSSLGRIVKEYPYVNESGDVLFQVLRYDPKEFRQRAPDGNGGWTWRVRGVRQVPYRLPELIEALASERLIVIAEGEKDVDNLWKLGIPATTNAGGAGKWRSLLNQFFLDADVVIIADNDPQATDKDGKLLTHADGRPKFTGFDHAHAIARELAECAASVRVMDIGRWWLDCPPKGDISDWIEAGGTIEVLNEVIDQLPDWSPDQAVRKAPEAEPRRATPYIAPDPASIPKRAWLFGGHYIRQAATATVAPGGFGKTTLTLYEAINMVAAGLTVWYLSGEDPKVEIDRRIAAHCKHHGVVLAAMPGKLFVDDRSTFQLFIGKSPRAAMVSFDEASLTQFEAAIVKDSIDVVMLDPFVSFHAVPENDNGCVDAVVKRVAMIAYRTNCCIEISHHVRKSFQGQISITVDDSRGGGAIINAVRSGRVINRMTSGEAETAKVDKEKRSSYIRVDRGKRNMAPPDKATWFRLVSVEIDNSDNVQALDKWDFPALMDGITIEDTEWVRDLVRQKAYRADSRSDNWLGIPVAERIGLNVNDKEDCKRLNKLFGIWLKNNVFKKLKMRDENSRKEFEFYVGMDAKPDRDITATVIQLFEDQEDTEDDSD